MGQAGLEPGMIYDVPRSLRRGETYDSYNTPRSLVPFDLSPPDGNITPLPQGEQAGSHDLLSVVPAPSLSQRSSSYELYDVPRTLTRDASKLSCTLFYMYILP